MQRCKEQKKRNVLDQLPNTKKPSVRSALGCGPVNRIVSLYLKYAELQTLERKSMTMQDWITKLDEFLKASGRRLLDHAGSVSADAAKKKATISR